MLALHKCFRLKRKKKSVLIDYTQFKKDCHLSLNGPYDNNEKQNLLSKKSEEILYQVRYTNNNNTNGK